MTAKKPNPQKRFLKLVLIFTLLTILIAAGLHIWFVNNARNVLKSMVADKSKGKLRLELSGLSFNFFNNMLQVRDADVRSTDSVSQPVTYNVKFERLNVHVNSFWPFLLHRQLSLDSLLLNKPDIEVVQWRADTSSHNDKNDLSVPQQMGKIYNSMLDALESFGIQRIRISDARLSLISKMNADSKPVVISGIQFDLWRKPGTTARRDEYVPNEQDVVLRTSNQDINLPSGRHKLSFRRFNLQLFQKRIELDSCTVTAFSADSSKSSYQIFFDKLLLIGVDFNAMYQYNLIRADSVYCEKPFFDIRLVPPKRDLASRKKEAPDLDKMVRELTGDLDLGYVGVKEAGIHIDMAGQKQRSLFNSSKDNFEMRGFRINADSVKPVVVKRFDMLVRDYHLYNADSSTSYSFDSIRFVNNKIVLNNFTVLTESGKLGPHNNRDFRIPFFELTGMDWYELVFDQNLKAEEAVLYDPVINFKRVAKATRGKKTSFFDALQTLDSLMTLDRIKIINGQLNMALGPASTFVLDDVNLSLQTNDLMKSTNREGLRKAVEYLSFSNGKVRLNDITATLSNIRYTGANLIRGDRLSISSSTNRISARMDNIIIDNMLLDDQLETVLVDGLRWSNAVLSLKTMPPTGKKNKVMSIRLNNINGKDTRLSIQTGKATITTRVQDIRISSVIKEGENGIQVNGLTVSGRDLKVNSEPMQVSATSYSIADNSASTLRGVRMERIKEGDSLILTSPLISFHPHVNDILAQDIHLSSLEASQPNIILRKKTRPSSETTAQKTQIRIDALSATEPVIDIRTTRNDSVTTISIPFSEGSRVKASHLTVDEKGMNLDNLSLNTNAATFVKGSGDTLGVRQGKVEVEMADIHLGRENGKPVWSAKVTSLSLQNPNTLMVGKNRNKLILQHLSLGNVQLSSDYLSNLNSLVKANVSLWLRTGTGEYADSNTTMKWYNADYSSSKKVFQLDSFQYRPTQHRDTVIGRSPYQTDYITFRSNKVLMTDFSLEKYEKDSAFLADNVTIHNPEITIYRDKKPPFHSGRIKPLPVNLIKSLDFPVSVGRVNLVDGFLSYTEKHAKTRQEGTLTLNHMNASLSYLRNENTGPNDSLSLSMNAWLLDSAYIDLRVKESYADTLGSFIATLRMRPTNLSFLNPVLVPMSNVKIVSGTIDSFHLRAIGTDQLAFGEMRMFYRGLKIRLIKDGDESRSSFADKMASFLVNTFLVKKNNNGRTGLVYFERLRDRSFFNYLVKMTFSGIATSVGVKKNKKYARKYNRKMKEANLPQVLYD